MLTPWKKSYDQPRQHIKKQRHYFVHSRPCSQGYGFSGSHMWMWELDYKESWALKNWLELWCWRRLLRVPWTARRSNQSIVKKSVLNIHWKDWCWSWNSSTLATLCEELTHLKRPWYWERLKVGVEGDDRGWDGWMASPTQWAWVWVNSGSWWWTGKPGVLQSMGLQSWTPLSNQTELICIPKYNSLSLSVSVSVSLCLSLSLSIYIYESESESDSALSDSLWSHGLYSPWNSPGQNTRVGSLSLLQGFFPTQELNPGLLHCRQILYQLSHKGSPCIYV